MSTQMEDHIKAGISKYHQDYSNYKFLARGSFGKVYSALQKVTKLEVAIKTTMNDSLISQRKRPVQKLKQSFNEQMLLARLSCIPETVPNVVGYIDSWITKKKPNNPVHDGKHSTIEQRALMDMDEVDAVYLVMELCKKGPLITLKGQMTENIIKGVLRSISACLRGLHELGIAHLDIKPENILITSNNNYKLADWGIARSRTRVKGEVFFEGDAKYLDQEVLDDHKFYQSQHYEQDLSTADVFSLGISLYELINDVSLPQSGEAWLELRSRPLQFSDAAKENYSSQMLLLIQQMTGPSETRPSFDQILKKPLLRDPALNELLWQELLNRKLNQDIKELQAKQRQKQQSIRC